MNDYLPIRVVCATRLPKNQFLTHSATGKSIRLFIETSPVQVRLYDENTTGLSELYNKAINECVDNPAILVFIHDDILIADYFWTQRIREGLNNFPIVGLIGNQKRSPKQASWRFLNNAFDIDQFENYSGVVGHGDRFPPKIISNFGAPGKQCKIVDGLLIAAKSQTLIDSNIRFDERFKFHFYDVDFCRSAELANLAIGTIPLTVIHESAGGFEDSWQKSYQIYMDKWKE